jgi:hypothetical protein
VARGVDPEFKFQSHQKKMQNESSNMPHPPANKGVLKISVRAGFQWLMPVIPATQEAENRRIVV